MNLATAMLIGLCFGAIAGCVLGFATAFVLMAIRELPPDPAPPRVLPFPTDRQFPTTPRLPS